MRLICPNCGAQYALADDVIPAAGRDVQCSNCAHTWFEMPGASSDDMPPEPRKPRAATPPPAPKEPGPFDGPISEAFTRDIDDDNLAPAPQPPKGRKTVDPEVADILRQEAQRESAQRQKETPATIESQSDLGLRDPAPASKTPAETAAASVGAVVQATAGQGTRRELLPDIEEINSSLRPDDAPAISEIAISGSSPAAKKRGFRRGFFIMLLFVVILVLIYTQAEMIKAAVPSLTDVLDRYVSTIDAGRLWLDDTVRSMLTSVSVDG